MGNSRSQADELDTSLPPAELSVALDRHEFYAGEALNGYVQVKVLHPVVSGGVWVELGCNAHTRVSLSEAREQSERRQDVAVLSRGTVQVARSSNSALKAGTFSFPFSFALDPSAPPSVLLHDERLCFAACYYYVRVRLEYVQGASKLQASKQFWFRVFSMPAHVPRPVTCRSASAHALRRLQSRLSGAGAGAAAGAAAAAAPAALMLPPWLALEVSLPKDCWANGELVRAEVRIANGSAERVRRVELSIEEEYEVHALGRAQTMRHLGETAAFRVDVAAGASTAVRTELPFGFVAPSLDLPLLKVRHTVVVRAGQGGAQGLSPLPAGALELRLPVTAYGFNMDFSGGSRATKHRSRSALKALSEAELRLLGRELAAAATGGPAARHNSLDLTQRGVLTAVRVDELIQEPDAETDPVRVQSAGTASMAPRLRDVRDGRDMRDVLGSEGVKVSDTVDYAPPPYFANEYALTRR
jgi:hypothetical protein